MNLHELQPESLFPTARLVFKAPERAASSESSKSDDKKSGEKKPDDAGSKKETDKNTPEKKDEKKKEAPQKISSVEIRNAARVRARNLPDNAEVQTALKKMEEAEAAGDAEGRKQANEAAGQLMEILKESNPEDKNLAYWHSEAEKDVNTGSGVTGQRGVISERKRVEEYNKSLKKVYDDINQHLPAWQTYVKEARDGLNEATADFNKKDKAFDTARAAWNAVESQKFPPGYTPHVYADDFDQELNWMNQEKDNGEPNGEYVKTNTSNFNILSAWKTKKAELKKAYDDASKAEDDALVLKNEWEEYTKKVEGEYEEYKKGLLKAAQDAGINHPADKPEDVGGPLPQSTFMTSSPSLINATDGFTLPLLSSSPNASDDALENSAAWKIMPTKFQNDYKTTIQPGFKMPKEFQFTPINLNPSTNVPSLDRLDLGVLNPDTENAGPVNDGIENPTPNDGDSLEDALPEDQPQAFTPNTPPEQTPYGPRTTGDGGGFPG
jgi:hypothetical protein